MEWFEDDRLFDDPEADLALPDYLRPPSLAEVTYGTLSFSAKTKQWVIRGEPCVVQLAKRLFPGAGGRGRGIVRFAASRRIAGDLNWLMLRYPLIIKNEDQWYAAYQSARELALQKQRLFTQPLALQPPPGFTGELMEFQKEGLGFLTRTGRALLADEMGLGKTVQALSYLAQRRQFPVLLVVPPHLVRNWKREAKRFLSGEMDINGEGRPPQVHIIRGLTPYQLPAADIYIIHYLLLRGWKKVLPGQKFNTVIFDEIQELRRTGTEKYSAASLLADSAESVIGLSGTPIYNRGGEIWNVINIIDYHALGDWDGFTREWCGGYGTDMVVQPQQLGEHLRREGLMLRRTKEQVLDELPPKRRLVQEIDADAGVFQTLMETAYMRLRRADELEEGPMKRLAYEQVAQEERQATGIAKAPHVSAFVRALVDAGESVLLFAHHHRVMDIYRKELASIHPVFITGRENDAQKDASLHAFMEGKSPLCCISLRAASGLNLQRASCVVFGELDWSPAVHSQAEDRAHRMGQKDSVLCYYLVSPRGSDQDMQEALGLKVSQFVGIMGDRVQSQEDVLSAQGDAQAHLMRVISRLRENTATQVD